MPGWGEGDRKDPTWGLDPDNCPQVPTSCFLFQRGCDIGRGPGQGWGLEPSEVSPEQGAPPEKARAVSAQGGPSLCP